MKQFPLKSSNQKNLQQQDYEKAINQASAMIGQDDLFQKLFLKPIEVILKTDKPGLPHGMRIVLKDDVSANKFKVSDFQAPKMQEWKNMSYQQVIEKNYDNLLSLIKSDQGIQLAICVCMYSQDKKMLKNTLAGISENIEYFVRSGISTDSIAVFVVMDGIQKVDPTVVQYFDQLQRQSNIILNNDAAPLGLHDFLSTQEQQEKYQEEITNINNILFTPAQLFQRQQRRFQTRVAEYQRIRQLMNLVDKLKKQKGLTYDVLDPRIQQFFIEVAKERRKQEYGQDQDQLKNKDKQFFIQNYAYDVVKSRPIIMEALVRARQFCQEYIKSRQSLSILNYFRTGVFVNKKRAKKMREQQIKDGKIQLEEDDDEDFDQARIRASKMNLFLCTKYKNSGKLSSHNWFFNGFCRQLDPRYAILLDVGLRPQKNALFKMYKYMVANEKVGGVCGYMGLRIQRVQDQLGYNDQLNEQEDIDCLTKILLKFVDIQRAQQMQYHFAHLIDKPFESIFKFIHVLPGAFSAYNMKALEQNNNLVQYFKSLDQKISNSTIVPSRYSAFDVIMKTALPQPLYYMFWPLDEKSEEQLLYNENIYLAQDRILCMGIHQNGYDMAFIPDAYAWVDPIKNVHTLLGQRKRWINGSFFAFEKVKKQLANQQHCQVFLRFQMYFLSFLNGMAYVAPALFLFTVSVAMQVFRSDVLMVYFSSFIPTEVMQGFVFVINFFYVMMIASIVFYSMHLTNKHKKFIPYIYATAMMLGIFALIVFIILAVDIVRGDDTFLITNQQFVKTLPFSVSLLDSMRYIIIIIIFMYAFPVLLYSILFKRFSFAIDTLFSALSFLFFSPTYLNILNIYALCRINDISWGTKGLDASSSSKFSQAEETWKVIRLLHVGKYILWNIVTAMLLLTLGSEYVTRFFVTFFIMMILGITLFIKVAMGCTYLINYWLTGRVQDPPEDAAVNEESRVYQFFNVIKPQIQNQVRRHVEAVAKQIQEGFKKTGPASVVLWGGRSNILAPGKKKENLKKGFQELQKLNASRIVKKDVVPQQKQFKGKWKNARNKDNFKKKSTSNNNGSDLSMSDKNQEDKQLNKMHPKPAKSKQAYRGGSPPTVDIQLGSMEQKKQRVTKSKEDYKNKNKKVQEAPKVEEPLKQSQDQLNAKPMPIPNKNKFRKDRDKN